jgi:hypothetical protein
MTGQAGFIEFFYRSGGNQSLLIRLRSVRDTPKARKDRHAMLAPMLLDILQ